MESASNLYTDILNLSEIDYSSSSRGNDIMWEDLDPRFKVKESTLITQALPSANFYMSHLLPYFPLYCIKRDYADIVVSPILLKIGDQDLNSSIGEQSCQTSNQIGFIFLYNINEKFPFKVTNKGNIREILALFHKYDNINFNKGEEYNIESFLKTLNNDTLNVFNKFVKKFIEAAKGLKINIYLFDSGEPMPTFQFLITPKKKNMDIDEEVNFLYKFISIKNNSDKNNILWFVNFALDY